MKPRFPSISKHWQRRLKILLALLVLSPPSKLLWDVYRVPDYRGGNAYVSTSPDEIYKGIDIFTPESTAYDGWSPFLLEISDYKPGMIMGLVDAKTGQMLAYVPIHDKDLSTGDGGFWECTDREKGPCVQYRSSFWYSMVELPPNRWHRLVAWMAFKLRGLGASDFSKVEERRSDVSFPGDYNESSQ